MGWETPVWKWARPDEREMMIVRAVGTSIAGTDEVAFLAPYGGRLLAIRWKSTKAITPTLGTEADWTDGDPFTECVNSLLPGSGSASGQNEPGLYYARHAAEVEINDGEKCQRLWLRTSQGVLVGAADVEVELMLAKIPY